MNKLIQKYFFVILPFVLVLAFSLIYIKTNMGDVGGQYKTVTIQPGQTVWEIAKQYSNDVDEQIAFVNWVQKNNHLSLNQLKEGEQLTIPVIKDNTEVILLAEGK